MVKKEIEIKAVYGISELARMAGVSRHKMRRLLIAGGVTFDRQGSDIVISQAELKEAMPRLWEGIEYRLAMGALYQESKSPQLPRVTEPSLLPRVTELEERVEDLESIVRKAL